MNDSMDQFLSQIRSAVNAYIIYFAAVWKLITRGRMEGRGGGRGGGGGEGEDSWDYSFKAH